MHFSFGHFNFSVPLIHSIMTIHLGRKCARQAHWFILLQLLILQNVTGIGSSLQKSFVKFWEKMLLCSGIELVQSIPMTNISFSFLYLTGCRWLLRTIDCFTYESIYHLMKLQVTLVMEKNMNLYKKVWALWKTQKG